MLEQMIVYSFDFPADYLPGETASNFKFVCEGWNKSIPFKNRATIQAPLDKYLNQHHNVSKFSSI